MKSRTKPRTGVDMAIVDSVKLAKKEGRLFVGPLDIIPTDEETLSDLELAAKQYAISRAKGSTSMPVTIRMEPEMIEALRTLADTFGVRGYQTLMKQWILERLTGEPMISLKTLANTPLGEVAKMVDFRKTPLEEETGAKIIAVRALIASLEKVGANPDVIKIAKTQLAELEKGDREAAKN